MIPLDAHAHVQVGASTQEVAGFAPSFVLAVTRSPEEWMAAARRRDASVAWGIGCHPANEAALRSFDEATFLKVVRAYGFIGEVGLDARSAAPRALQDSVLSSVLRVAAGEGVVVSMHSAGRIDDVLDAAERFPTAKVVLHWWGGTAEQTARAIRLGCAFSINGAVRPHVLAALPREGALTETDFPFSAYADKTATAPGRVARPLALLSRAWNVPVAEVIDNTWRVLDRLDSSGRLRGRNGRLRDLLDAAASRTPAPGRPAVVK
jgi:TatD DNase family protein